MSFFSLFSSPKKTSISLIVEIDSSSVNGSLVEWSTNLPKILYTTRVLFEKNSTLPTYSTSMIKALHELLTRIHAFSDNKKTWSISEVNIVFTLPWYTTQTKHIHVENPKPFIVSPVFIEDILKKEFEIYQKKLEARAPQSTQYVCIENEIYNTEINGYVLQKSFGKKTNTFDAFLLQSVIYKSIHDEVLKHVFDILNIYPAQVEFLTSSAVSAAVITSISFVDLNFVILNISSEGMIFSLVEEGVIKNSILVPHGYNSITRLVSKTLGVPEEIAESFIHLYSRAQLSDELFTQLDEIIRNLEKEWLIYFQDALESLSPTLHLPTKMFLLANKNISRLYAHFIKHSGEELSEQYFKDVDVTQIHHETFENNIQNPASLVHDISLALIAVFLHIKKMKKVK